MFHNTVAQVIVLTVILLKINLYLIPITVMKMTNNIIGIS